MNPLVESFANGTVEDELRQLFMRLYGETLAEKAAEINVYGAPHLGPFSLIERNVTQEGLAVMRQDDEPAMRYLFKAWRNRNPRRGTHFLRTYLRALFGEVYDVQQLHQLKEAPYPTRLLSADELVSAGYSESEAFLTSRLRVDLDTNMVTQRVIRSLQSVVAARFVLTIRMARRARTALGVANVVATSSLLSAEGETRLPKQLFLSRLGTGGVATTASVLVASGRS